MAFSCQNTGLPPLRPGLPADGTIAAEVAFMFNEWYKPDACLEFPRGGSQAIVNALVRCAGPTMHPPMQRSMQPLSPREAPCSFLRHSAHPGSAECSLSVGGKCILIEPK